MILTFLQRLLSSAVSSVGHLVPKMLPTSIQNALNLQVAWTALYFGKYSRRKSSCSLVDHPCSFLSSFGFALDLQHG